MTIQQIKDDLAATQSIDWENLPDLDLYLDQTITYLSREQIKGCPEAELTPSMVNNYVKAGLVPRAIKKKYNREHLVYLRMINAFKQVYNVKEMKDLLDLLSHHQDPTEMYHSYQSSIHQALSQVEQDLTEDDPSELAMRLAVQSVVYKMVSKRLLEQTDATEK